jgi:hypothetical protein
MQMSQQWLAEIDNVPMYNTAVYVIFNLSDHTNYYIVMPCVGVSGTTPNGQKEEWQWGGRSLHKYLAIFQCIEVYCALPVTKGINFKSGKLNEHNEQSLRKSMYVLEKNRYKMHEGNN